MDNLAAALVFEPPSAPSAQGAPVRFDNQGVRPGSKADRAMRYLTARLGQKAAEGSGMCAATLRHALGVSSLGDAYQWPQNLGRIGYFCVGRMGGEGVDARPGDIVCMPWMAKGVGHVGLVGENGRYISNFQGRIIWKAVPNNALVFREGSRY